jgi:hypothetical protein
MARLCGAYGRDKLAIVKRRERTTPQQGTP